MYESMHVILSDLNKLDCDEVKLALEDSTLVQDALVAATDDNGDIAIKLKCTNLLLEIWLLHPDVVSNPDKQHYGIGSLALKDTFQYVFEQGLYMRDKVFSVNVYANGFLLLDRLATKGNPDTLTVYSSLVNGLLSIYRGKQSDRQIDQVSTEIILKGFSTVFAESEEEHVPKHLLLNPFLEQLILNLRQHQEGENLMTTCELEFLTNIIKDHCAMLDEGTVSLLLQYFWRIHRTRPYLAHALKLSTHISELVNVHKETSVEIMQQVEETVIPEALEHYSQIKKSEVELSNAKNTPSQRKSLSKRVPDLSKRTQNARAMNRDIELAAERRLKRHLIISFLDRLHEALDGTVN